MQSCPRKCADTDRPPRGTECSGERRKKKPTANFATTGMILYYDGADSSVTPPCFSKCYGKSTKRCPHPSPFLCLSVCLSVRLSLHSHQRSLTVGLASTVLVPAGCKRLKSDCVYVFRGNLPTVCASRCSRIDTK